MRLSIGLTTYYNVNIIKFKRMIMSLVADFTTTEVMVNTIHNNDDLNEFLMRLDDNNFKYISIPSDTCVEVMVIVDNYDPSKGTFEQHRQYDKTIEQIKNIVNSIHINGVIFTTYVTKGNNRVSANRNYCIVKARGEWLRLIDDDDVSCNINELLRAIDEGDKYDKECVLMYIMRKHALNKPTLSLYRPVSFIVKTNFLRVNKLYFDIDIVGEDYQFRLKLHDKLSSCIVLPIISYIGIDKSGNNNSHVSAATYALRAGLYVKDALSNTSCIQDIAQYFRYNFDLNGNKPLDVSEQMLKHAATVTTIVSTWSYVRSVMLKYDYMFADKTLLQVLRQLDKTCDKVNITFNDVMSKSTLQFAESMLSTWHALIPFDRIYEYAVYLKQLIDKHGNANILNEYMAKAKKVKQTTMNELNINISDAQCIDDITHCLIVCIMQNVPLYELYSDFNDISYSLLDDFTKRYVLVKAACGNQVALSCIDDKHMVNNVLMSISKVLDIDQRTIPNMDIVEHIIEYVYKYTNMYGIFIHAFLRLVGIINTAKPFKYDTLIQDVRYYVKRYCNNHINEVLACIPDNTSNDILKVITYKEDANKVLKKYRVNSIKTMDEIYTLSNVISNDILVDLATDIAVNFKYNVNITNEVPVYNKLMLTRAMLMMAPYIKVSNDAYDNMTFINIHREMTIINTITGTTDTLKCLPY